MNRRLLLLAPLAGAAAAGGGFYAMLHGMQTGSFDSRAIPSPLVGKRVPAFALPGLTDADLAAGHPLLVNFFASWCEPCAEEAPALMALKQAGVPIVGIAYKDAAIATDRFLAQHGDPFARLAADPPGRISIDWGVTGVPETFLVGPDGVIRWHFAGPLSAAAVGDTILPLMKRYA